MQKVDQDRDIAYHKASPSPHKYEPIHVGKELSQDSVKYSFRSKAHPQEFVEKKKNENKPGPGVYMERKNLDYFSNDIRYNNKF